MVVLALAVLGALLAASPAAAGSKCAKQVIADWYDNGRVDRIYPLHCYREAIKTLPVDVRDYSSAREDIERALQYATRDEPDPGDSGGGTTTAGSAGGGSTTPAETGSGSDAATTAPITTTGPKPGTPPRTGPRIDTGSQTEAGGAVDTSGPSSVPIPLIILGGLALLLLAAGSAGYIARRLHGRGGGAPPA